MSKTKTVLGWDAAWTPHGSGAWCVLRSAEVEGQLNELMVWEHTPGTQGETFNRLNQLLKEFSPDMIAIDMPISKKAVTGYREADRATTRAFSRYGCPVHSPTPERPGTWGEACMKVLFNKGYEIDTGKMVKRKAVAEVYPHTALLEILRLSYRLPYKITRHRQLWPEVTSQKSKQKCCEQQQKILNRLGQEIDLNHWETPFPPLQPLSGLKAFEDRIDALICGWVGFQVLQRKFLAYGDDSSAIWNPDVNSLDPSKRTP